MPLVKTPKPTFAQKIKRFFFVDLLKGMGLTLKYNLGAITDKDAVAGKGIYTEQYPKVRPDVAPRFRYDQLMDIGWKWLIPSALINIAL